MWVLSPLPCAEILNVKVRDINKIQILYSWNRIMQFYVTFRCKFNKGDENKIPILLAQSTQIVRYVRTSLGGGHIWLQLRPPPMSNTVGDISPSPLHICSAHRGSLNKCQVYLRPAVQAEASFSVGLRHNAGRPLKGPGKFWNIDAIWGYILLLSETNCAF